MDKIDFEILKQLEQNAKMTTKEVAAHVHLSAPAVAERIKNSKNNKLLRAIKL